MVKVKKCSLCGKSSFKTLFHSKDRMFPLPGKFTIKKCRNCGLVFLDPQPSIRNLKRYYPSKKYYAYNSVKQGFFASLRSYLLKNYYNPGLFIKIILVFTRKVPAIPSYKKGGKILDIGCGNGETLFLLKQLGWRAFGIELSKSAVDQAKRRGLKDVYLGSFEKLEDFPDNFFDSIRLYHVIEHLHSPDKCIRLIYKKLKKGGEVIIGTPNINSLVARIFSRYWYNLDSPRHLFLFEQRTLKEMLGKEKFKIKRLEFFSAGGFLGSLQYFINDKFRVRAELIQKIWLVTAAYPLERLIDKFKMGDFIVVRAIKYEKK